MSKRRNRVSNVPVMASIEKFSHDGRGIARIEGKTTFIQGVLPEETVMFQYVRQKRDYDEGKLLTVLTPSLHRVEPRCNHYSLCGGCSLQHVDEKAQIQEKQELLLDLLMRIGHVQPECLLKPLTHEHWHYRNKARLSVRFVEKKNATLIGFREKNNPRYIAEISACPILNARIDAEIPALRTLIDSLSAPHCIAQIEVAAGDEDIALILRNLTPLTSEDEDKIRTFAERANFRIFLQPGGMDSVYLFYPKDGNEFLSYCLPEEQIHFHFHPTDFTQINPGLNRLMVKHAMQLLELSAQDKVLDLFCGLGNFSLPMARHCRQVIGVEGSEAMVARARMNAKANGLSNTDFICANLEEESAVAQLGNSFNKLLLDPPRAGAMAVVKQIHKIASQRIVYVSCNPATLARDADILVNQQGYRLTAAGVMDMFPHTTHVESIAVFEKARN
ncbi:23S rRNA (uracil(1939)-C(5))-methyltransferase RlmD [Legionella oakridgensis]|uniref:23S rRNA (uracil(1939)-C(5))-methyltransferase RlmD n=2 Tax=Legionella oakridgensis TaxID=29423 RepID=W0BFV8_9GAMM|nr:23S rRNA (uracil(1939)-C(5))-methyltransferase RlmD [Legionella oakridgensis]AHE67309.1 23S rRNA uracil-5--methyltransferase RumA [Legionella oakridgensis ATCC 33761 = DSM 21215]ETO93061.1 23S rRNA m(5)U-1939 methyltransferase [Legionella oakridgensis RV-2-2007]KTD37903.1 23S rRNA 5-methyluridine methyltransferase [Legionella oakridgensis]STY20375.1 23S rRNA (uracil-5-)-methyltransferase RumA [Legionella longbeachae]